MRVAITGGSGIVGGALLRHLIDAGHEVRALARHAESVSAIELVGGRPVMGDVLDEASVERLVAGCQWVFHVAGVNEMCSLDPSAMWKVNVDGATTVVEASKRAGVARLIHTSSAVTIGEALGTIGSERSPHRGHFLSEYERSKTVGERLVLDRAGELEVVVVNPSSVQGPGRSTGTGALFLALARGSLPIVVDTTISLVDIDDCAAGHLLAAAHGVSGERYILSGATVALREGVRTINETVGRHSRPWFVRGEVISGLAPTVDAVFRLVGLQPPLCAESARVVLGGHAYDGTRATRDLGLTYRPHEETLGRTIDWFIETGLLQGPAR